ncbi:hypothetical protein [Candidatus Poriferisodalis sp.]|uniref:hypothetical protein n=1 Tax=Candidatus Poriferisodalis sp. TaxID=3101277 RepID=UPI003C6F8B34
MTINPYVDATLLGPNTNRRDCHQEFAPSLRAWLTNLEYFADAYGAYGSLTKLVYDGMYVSHRTSPSFHNTGEAIDIKWFDWSSGTACRPCNADFDVSSSTSAYRRMVGVEASLRKYFGNVVSRGYRGTDPDTGEILPYVHADHFHADTGCPVSFSTGKESNQLFARDCIRAFTLDTTTGYLSTSATNPNQWTTAHQASLDALLASLSMDCFDIDTNISEYLIFLDYIMMHAFADRAAGHFRWSGAQDL